MKASVVVVSWRPHRWLEPCLASVLDQADEVIVVDNGSPGGFATNTARRLGATPVPLRRNAGFPGGVNAGLAAATGDVVALLNDDAIAEPGWLAATGATLADPTVAAVAPKLLLADRYAVLRYDDVRYGDVRYGGEASVDRDAASVNGDDPRPLGRQLAGVTVRGRDVLDRVLGGVHPVESAASGGGPARWRWTTGTGPVFVPLPDGAGPGDVRAWGEPVAVEAVVDLVNNAGSYLSRDGHGGDYAYETPDSPVFSEPADRFAACGAAMAATAETFAKLGGFAASFFAYYEDTDWCWRAQLAGLRIRYEPAAVVRHVRSVSTGGSSSERVRFLAARNRLHCLARNAPLDVLRDQLRRARDPGLPKGLAPALCLRVPAGLAERRRLSRHWRRHPADVFEEWAGVGESWPS